VSGLSAVAVGDELPTQTVRITRADLVRYAGASGDLNPIHYSDRIARAVGLPDVIAHGMLTMGHAVRLVSDWAGDPGRVVACSTRFTRPVVVPDDDIGASLSVSGKVTAVDAAAGTATVAITVTCDGVTVLGRSQATVALG
jgi:acyl dehydratase